MIKWFNVCKTSKFKRGKFGVEGETALNQNVRQKTKLLKVMVLLSKDMNKGANLFELINRVRVKILFKKAYEYSSFLIMNTASI